MDRKVKEKIGYQIKNKIDSSALSSAYFDGVIGTRFDRFTYERLTGAFALEKILAEAEDCFADQYDDEYACGVWRGEFWGKLMLSLVRTARFTEQNKTTSVLKQAIHNSVYKILSCQRADGYLSTYRNSEAIFPADIERARKAVGWDCNYNWNVWGQKYTLWGLLEAAMYLDDPHILVCAQRMADFLIAQIKRLGVCVGDIGVMHGMAAGSILKPMLLLYRLTGNESYLAFCLEIADGWDREDHVCPNLIRNAMQDISPSRWYDQKNGYYAKAYEMMSCYDGLCELYRVTGDSRYFDAVRNFWLHTEKYESNILGSVGYCERFYDAADYADSATEICDVVHWMRLSYELFCLTGEGMYMDAFEKAFLNAFLAGIYEDGKNGAFFVRSAGRHWTAEPQVETKYQHCCLNNAARGFTNALESAVTMTGDDLRVNLYIPTRTHFVNSCGGNTTVRVSSGYTDRGVVNVIVRGAVEGSSLYLRIPAWSKTFSAEVIDGGSGSNTVNSPGTYLKMPVTQSDMIIRIHFDMRIRVVDPVCHYCGTDRFCVIPADDYHRQRWVDSNFGFCDSSMMLPYPKAVVWRGPVLLARSKRIGCTETEMFSDDRNTVYGKQRSASGQLIRHDNMLCMCRVQITVDDHGETITQDYVMCDFSSAANRELEDAHYFTVYI